MVTEVVARKYDFQLDGRRFKHLAWRASERERYVFRSVEAAVSLPTIIAGNNRVWVGVPKRAGPAVLVNHYVNAVSVSVAPGIVHGNHPPEADRLLERPFRAAESVVLANRDPQRVNSESAVQICVMRVAARQNAQQYQ